MSYTSEEEKFGKRFQELMANIEDIRAVIKARRLNSSEWTPEHIQSLVEFDTELDKVFWKCKEMGEENR